MKSLLLEKIGKLGLQDMPVPVANSDETLLKVTHCGVCRTDAKMWERGHRDLVFSRILGHEICGYDEVSKERFVVWPGKACGKCRQCKKGAENLCDAMQIIGFHKDGGFAEYVAAPKYSLVPIPDELPGNIAALAEPFGCAINATELSNVSPGDNVLIYGAGAVGLFVALSVKAHGGNPFVQEINAVKLRKSEKFQNHIGITTGLSLDISNFQTVINAAPSLDTFVQGLKKLEKGGTFCIFSAFTDQHSLSADLLNEIHYRQLKITGAYGCTRYQMEQAVQLLLKYKNEAELLIEAELELSQVHSVLPEILSGKMLKFVVCGL